MLFPRARTRSEEDDLAHPTGAPVMVFAPSPILTVTLEVDSAHGDELHLHAGGQGFWVARMIRSLEHSVVLVAPFGGEAGRVLRVLIEAEGVELRGVDVAGPNGAYVDDRRSSLRERIGEVPGGRLSRHESDDLYNAALVTGLEADVVVLTGQWPNDVLAWDAYRRLALDLRANGRVVVADLSGRCLDAALKGGIDLLKVSEEELIRDGLAESPDPAALVRAMEGLVSRGARAVLLSRGAEPALARVDDRLLELVVPRIEPADFRGAGDSMTAALAVGLARRLPSEAALRMAAAAGSLNVTRHGLGTGRPADVESLARHVTVRPWAPSSDAPTT